MGPLGGQLGVVAVGRVLAGGAAGALTLAGDGGGALVATSVALAAASATT